MQTPRIRPQVRIATYRPPEGTIALFNFKVLSERVGRPVAVLPFRLNQQRLDRQDPDYLARVAETVLTPTLN